MFLLQSVDREEADVPIVGMIFFIIHVIYTMLHLFIYCYVGETLLGQVESLRVMSVHYIVLPSKMEY